MVVEKASYELGDAVRRILTEHQLTDAEIQVILNRESAIWLKYAIRHERHPDDPGKRGDEE
jgi:hypothetical protein